MSPRPFEAMLIVHRLLVLLCFMAGPVAAHDSWLSKDKKGQWTVITGSRYPLADAGVQPARPTCRSRRGASACWTQLPEHRIELEPKLVDVYLKEIRPPQSHIDAWAAMREAGLPWRESYRKFVRIESGTSRDPAVLRDVRRPAGLPLEIVVEGDEPIRVGKPNGFRVLAGGVPVPGFSVELVSAKSPIGVWQRTDAQGRVQYTPPFNGEWALRGTLLERDGDTWRSKFVTLVFDID